MLLIALDPNIELLNELSQDTLGTITEGVEINVDSKSDRMD